MLYIGFDLIICELIIFFWDKLVHFMLMWIIQNKLSFIFLKDPDKIKEQFVKITYYQIGQP